MLLLGAGQDANKALTFSLPTPPFGSTNVVAWWDATQTFTNALGVAVPSIYYDTVGYNTVSAWEDLSGSGNGWWQPNKALQPNKGVQGRPVVRPQHRAELHDVPEPVDVGGSKPVFRLRLRAAYRGNGEADAALCVGSGDVFGSDCGGCGGRCRRKLLLRRRFCHFD